MTEVKCFCCEQKKFFTELPGVIRELTDRLTEHESELAGRDKTMNTNYKDIRHLFTLVGDLEKQIKDTIAVEVEPPQAPKPQNVATGPEVEMNLRNLNNKLLKFVYAVARDNSSDFSIDYLDCNGRWYNEEPSTCYVEGARRLLGMLEVEAAKWTKGSE